MSALEQPVHDSMKHVVSWHHPVTAPPTVGRQAGGPLGCATVRSGALPQDDDCEGSIQTPQDVPL